MFGLGYQELLLILVIVLILFGAQRLPDLARSLGSSVKEFKKGVTDLKDEASATREEEGRRQEGLTRPQPPPPPNPPRLLVPPDRYAVGIDLGGSKLRGGLLNSSGQLIGRLEVQTEAWKGPPSVIANLKSMITRLVDSTDPERVAGIGIAAAGQIHPKTHAVVYAPNLEWENVPLRDEIESAFGMPVYRRERRAGGRLGRISFRGGAGAESLDRRIRRHRRRLRRRGGRYPACRARAMRRASSVTRRSFPTACPVRADSHGCIEAYASGRGFARRLEAALAAGTETRLARETERQPFARDGGIGGQRGGGRRCVRPRALGRRRALPRARPSRIT